MSHSSVEVLKKKLTDAWDRAESETLRATCAHVIQRLRRVIQEKGGYVEKSVPHIKDDTFFYEFSKFTFFLSFLFLNKSNF